MTDDVFAQLTAVIEARRAMAAEDSYVASLFHKGQDKILEKVGEEAIETILASKTGDSKKIVYETADLWFHSMIMLAHHGLTVDDVTTELARRFGVSGHVEKASRSKE
jgi:phosphoribosyl-ATP pyrophosphohydrolase